LKITVELMMETILANIRRVEVTYTDNGGNIAGVPVDFLKIGWHES